MKYKESLTDFAETVVCSLVVILLLYIFIASVEVVWGESMEPNFHTGERILVEKISENFRSLERGDVVVFVPVTEEDKHLIKRVVGIPGDIVKIFECKIYVSRDGQKFELSESYLLPDTCTNGGSYVQEGRSLRLQNNQYMLLGDNRENSLDSRMLGIVDKSRIVGRVIFRFWPPSQFGFIK